MLRRSETTVVQEPEGEYCAYSPAEINKLTKIRQIPSTSRICRSSMAARAAALSTPNTTVKGAERIERISGGLEGDTSGKNG